MLFWIALHRCELNNVYGILNSAEQYQCSALASNAKPYGPTRCNSAKDLDDLASWV